MRTWRIKERVIWLFIIAAIVLAAPIIVRVIQGNPFVAGGETVYNTYYNLGIAKQIQEKGILERDALQNRDYSFNLFHYLLAGLGFINLDVLSMILPFIFGMLFFWLAYKILLRFDFSPQRVFFILLFVIFTPAFILLFTTLTKFALVLLLNLLGFYFLKSESLPVQGLAMLFFALVPLVDFFAFILTFLMLLFFVLVYKKKVHLVISSFTLSLIFMWVAYLFLHYRITYFDFITNSFSLGQFLTDFGAVIGYSFFMLLLALIGFVFASRKNKNIAASIIFTVLFAFSFFNASLRVYMSFVFVLGAAYAFDYLLSKEWSLTSVKRVTVLLILCTLIFSAVSFLNRQFEEEPNKELVDALHSLRVSPFIQGGTVLTHYSKGFYVEYFSELPVVLDGFSYQYAGYQEELNMTTRVFETRDLVFAEEYFQKRGIKYILITDDMRRGLVWRRPHEGMLFLLENSGKFINIYSQKGVDIYLYLGRG
jgi:hypothetical protein